MATSGQVDHRSRSLGSLLISSPQGHSGKTTVTLGLCHALKRRGLSVQPFKKGPDYIDASWLTVATGRSCRNLDPFLIPQEKLIQTFQQSSGEADLAIVEGNMGLYDGVDAHGTTAEIARLFSIPVLLVVNTARMTGSIAAMVSGYQHFQKDIHIAGVILNYVSGKRHEMKLRDAVEQYCGIPVLGSLARDQDLHISERHLGLIPSLESGEAESIVERIGVKLEPHFDLDGILKIAREHKSPCPVPLPSKLCRKSVYGSTSSPRTDHGTSKNNHLAVRPERVEGRAANYDTVPSGERERVRGGPSVRIGVIRDRAFNFYYPENLQALINEGAELFYLDSFKDRLPELDGLYIGGGFPEFFLKELEGNRELRRDIAQAVEEGLPVYAECAGLMYLCRSISWQGRSYEMTGIIPSRVQLSERPEGHGYVVAEVMAENPFFPVGLTVRGHEFHHSSLLDSEDLRFAYGIRRGRGVSGKKDGIVYRNLFASYVHLHALGTPEWASGFVSLALKERKGKPHRVEGA
jgi:cobyrinic acid a,c-diamide synthase